MEYFDLVESIEYLPAQNISSFKLRIFNIVSVCFYLAHYPLRNFCNTMSRREPVGVIRQPSSSGSGGEDGLEFIRCVGRRQPQGVFPRTELLAKFILSRALTSTTSPETASRPITPLKWDLEWTFTAEYP